MRINSNDNLPVKKELEMHGAVLITKSAFYHNDKFYSQVFFIN